MAKAKKLPSGSWRCQVYAGFKKDSHGAYIVSPKTGKRIPDHESITAATKDEAEYLAAQYKVDRTENMSRADMTVKQAMEQYVANRSNVLSPTTIQGYKKIINNNLQGIMDIKIKKLTQEAVQAAVNADAETLSPKTMHNAHGFLSAVLAVYRPRMMLRTSLKPQKKRIRDLPLPGKIIDAVRGTRIELAALLALWLSFTVSEIRGIKKSDIKDGVLTLNRVIVDVDGKPVIKEDMKEYARTRRHEIPPYIMELISKCDTDFIVPLNANQIDWSWRSIRRRAGLPEITFHSLRAVNASVMLLLGVPDKYAMDRGGWITDATMKSVYQSVFTDERRTYDRKINDYFESIIGAQKTETSHDISHSKEKSP